MDLVGMLGWPFRRSWPRFATLVALTTEDMNTKHLATFKKAATSESPWLVSLDNT